MVGKRFPLVMVPRFSTYIGSGEFASLGIDVSKFVEARVHVWRGEMSGTGILALTVKFEESTDRVVWFDCDGGAPLAIPEDDETSFDLTLSRQYLRIVPTVAGTDPAVTLYAVGHLNQRTK